MDTLVHHDTVTSDPDLRSGSDATILLHAAAYDRSRHELSALDEWVRWLVMDADGQVHLRDHRSDRAGPGSLDSVRVAWATADLFDAGGLRHFTALLRRAERLEWFQAAGAGTEHPIYRQLAERGIRITTNHASTIPIAEFVIRAALDHVQQAARWRDSAAERRWARHEFGEVAGSTWLIVGLGHIGRAVAQRARALGAHTIGLRRSDVGAEHVDELDTPDALTEHAGRADVLVVAAPLTSQTHHLIDASVLGRMREGSLLVNVSRGELVDDEALLGALDQGRPAHATLDVFAAEPLPATHPYWVHPRVTVTPHASGMSTARHSRSLDLFLDNLDRWMRGRPLLNDATPTTAGEQR